MANAEYIRPDIWAKTNGRCWYCGCDLSPANWSVDHFLPPGRGGSDLPNNLVPACRPCNSAKGNSASLDGLREYLIGIVTRNRRPVRVKAKAAPLPEAKTIQGRTVIDITSIQPGPFFTLAFYFEEQGLKL